MTENKITPTDELALVARVQHALDNKTKPQGSLGRIESLALQIAQILNCEQPILVKPQLVVFAADHGIAAQGVSAYPSDVTWQMVENFLNGGAAVSVLARQHGLTLTVVDCGVNHDFAPRDGLVIAKTARCSSDLSVGPAMSTEQLDAAMRNGHELVKDLSGNVLLLGEMGIGNTSAAALLMARLTGLDLSQCIGRGTGLDDEGLARKQIVLSASLDLHVQAQSPLEALRCLGGLEIATMTGAIIAAAEQRRVIVVDGFISTAAAAIAVAIEPSVLQRCVFAHCSAESGHERWLTTLGVEPLLNLGLRLGEGSGAAMAWPLLDSATRLLREMASFESARISTRD